MNTKITAKASIGIQKPVEEVFEAIVNPELMANYFIAEGSGKMEKGAEVIWKFPEFDDKFPVSVKEIINNKQVSFIWDPNSMVEIHLEKLSENNTVVRVWETGHQNDEAGIKWVVEQSEGWANFLACMKGWLEYGIHLRKGAFDFTSK